MGVARPAESDVRVALSTLKDSTPSEWTTAGGAARVDSCWSPPLMVTSRAGRMYETLEDGDGLATEMGQ